MMDIVDNEAKNCFCALVEDNEDHAYLIKKTVAKAHCVRLANVFETAEDALDAMIAAEELPNFILLDINLPEMNGFELVQAMRAHPQFDNIGVVILTTSDVERDKEQAAALNISDYIVKPLRPEDLSRVAQKYCH